MKEEVWKDVIGYEGYYQVSNIGTVRSIERTVTYQFKTGVSKTMRLQSYSRTQFLNARGYWSVTLSKDGKTKTYVVHILVAKAFIPNVGNKPCVNHKDLNRQNNTVENLEWVTHQENMAHAAGHGLLRNKTTKLTWDDVVVIRGIKNKTQREIAEMYNVTQTNINCILKNKTWLQP